MRRKLFPQQLLKQCGKEGPEAVIISTNESLKLESNGPSTSFNNAMYTNSWVLAQGSSLQTLPRGTH